jgi:hypothetical protein
MLGNLSSKTLENSRDVKALMGTDGGDYYMHGRWTHHNSIRVQVDNHAHYIAAVNFHTRIGHSLDIKLSLLRSLGPVKLIV